MPGSMGWSPADDPELMACLVAARAGGFLGPMPVVEQIRHALGLAAGLSAAPTAVVDLGSGGGVPSLVLARLVWPQSRWHLVESNARRASFLGDSLVGLGLADRVVVQHRRAEEAGRDPALRHRFEAVVARSFGPPAVTAECAAPFLEVGGAVVVSEPPIDAGSRWPTAGLALLALALETSRTEPVHVVTLRSTGRCADRYPRRVGVPAKRPLF